MEIVQELEKGNSPRVNIKTLKNNNNEKQQKQNEINWGQ